MRGKRSWKHLKPWKIFTSGHSILKPAEQMYSLPNRIEPPISDSGIARHQIICTPELKSKLYPEESVSSRASSFTTIQAMVMTRLRVRAYQQNPRDGTDPKLSASRNGQDGSCPSSDSRKHGEIGNSETAQTHNLLPGGGHPLSRASSTIQGYLNTKHKK